MSKKRKKEKQIFQRIFHETDLEDFNSFSPSRHQYNAPFNFAYEPTLDELDEKTIDDSLHLPFKQEAETTSLNQILDESQQTKKKTKCCGRLKDISIKIKKELQDATIDGCTYMRNRCTPKYCGNTKKCLWYFSKKWLPCLRWLPRYSLRDLQWDVVAGLTTGFAVLIQSIAYTGVAEISPLSHGLYSSIMGSYAYAVLGGINEVAVSPSLNLNVLIAQYATSKSPIPNHYTYPTILAFFSGVILLFCGFCKLGFLFNFVPMPVWKAFRTAAFVYIIFSRLNKWWGLVGVPRDFLGLMYWTFKKIPEINWYDFGLGTLCLVLLTFFKKLRAYKWPEQKTKLQKVLHVFFWILGTERNLISTAITGFILYAFLKINKPLSHVPEQPVGVPFPSVPNFTLTIPPTPNSTHNTTTYRYFSEIANDIGAGFIFVPSFIMYEHLSTASTFARKFNQRLDFNTELIAMGASNILTSSIRGYPVTGVLTRSSLNYAAGVRRPASGILAGTIVIIASNYFISLAYYLSIPAMACLVILAGIDSCSFQKLGYVWFANKREVVPWIATFVSSLLFGIEYGILVGVGINNIIFLFQQIYPSIVIKVLSTKSKRGKKVKENETVYKHIELHFKDYLSTINFLSANQLHNFYLRHIDWNDKNLKSVAFNLKDVTFIDTSIIYKLKILKGICHSKEITFKLSKTKDHVKEKLKKAGFVFEKQHNIKKSSIEMTKL